MSVAIEATAFDQFARAQPAAATALQQAVAGDAVAHAWLLLGPPGVGQVEAARFLGAALNCDQRGEDGRPCGRCGPCVRVLHGTHTAVQDFEAEGAFHRVDDVRGRWIPAATTTSIEGRARVLRIEAADKMNEAAQNAFLKILEEPPPGVVWILDVADDAALLDTIISRCRRLDVRPWSRDLLRERLELWVRDGDGDPGLGSGAEPPDPVSEPGKRVSKKVLEAQKVDHLDALGGSELEALVRLSKGSPEALAVLSTCDGRRLRTLAAETVPRILDAGPKAAGGIAPTIANDVLRIAVEAEKRVTRVLEAAHVDLGRSLGVLDAEGNKLKGRDVKWPPGVEKAHKDRLKRESRAILTGTCRRYLDLVAAYLHDVLAVGGGAGAEGVGNTDRVASLQRAAERVDPVGIIDALGAIEHAHLAFDLNGERKLQLEAAIIRVVLACARG